MMDKNMSKFSVVKNIIMVFMLTIISNICLAAGSVTNVKVTEVSANKHGMGMIKFETVLTDNELTDEDRCSVGFYRNALTVDLDTYAGRSMLSIALAAYASGNKVVAKGTGGCVLDVDTIEDAASIRVVQ